MQNRGIALLAIAAMITIISCSSNTDIAATIPNNKVTFAATMTFGAETPAPLVASTGTGTFTATLDTVTSVFTWDLTFTGLTSAVNNGHIHGPAAATATSGTSINFNTAPGATFGLGLTAGTGHGSMVLNTTTAVTATMSGDSLKKLLFAGLTYANIHTTSNPGGEIRGQITKQ